MADVFSPEMRSWVMSRVKSGDTRPERQIRSILHRLGYRFRLRVRSLPGAPDIVMARHKTVIFVHGCFWHGHTRCRKGRQMPVANAAFWLDKITRNRDRDRRTRRKLQRLGWKVFTFWECDIRREEVLSRKIASLVAQLTPKSAGST